MNTRKANLKKLRLPTAGTLDSRNGRRKVTTTISTFFTPEATPTTPPNKVEITVYSQPLPSPIDQVEDNLPKSATRTKLSSFLPKELRLKQVPDKPITEFLTKSTSDDFETAAKNIKKAPKAKAKPRPKRQQKIKTAFHKNEEIFSTITAQHCLVDNINPDEMQLALALSRSEADVSGVIVVDDEEDDRTNEDKTGIRNKLKKFGFRVAESEDYNLTAFLPSKKKTNWANKFTALTLRNPKRQLEKINQRVEELLGAQCELSDSVPADETWSCSVESENLSALIADDHVIIRSDVNERVDVVEFYVLSLFTPSKTKAGYLLKDIRRIAGRDRTPNKIRPFPKGDIVVDPQLQSPLMKKSRGHEALGLSLPCPDTLENLEHSIPATIESIPYYKSDMKMSPTCSSFLSECVTANGCLEERSLPYSSPADHSKMLELKIKSTIGSFPNVHHEELINAASPRKEETPLSVKDYAFNSNNTVFNQSATLNSMEISTPPMSAMAQTPRMHSGDDLQTQIQISSIRSTSPDIFADSDVEMESDVCTKMSEFNCSKLSSDKHHITTYESFSSDEEKIFSDTKNNSNDINHNSIPTIIDLTECASNSNSQKSDGTVDIYQDRALADCAPSTSLTARLREDKFDNPNHINRTGFSFGSSASEDFHKSNSFSRSKTEDSIDLTQTSDGDNERVLLSDDEINYSIWRTEKPMHDKDEEDHCMGHNATVDNWLNSSMSQHEFSFVDLVADSQPLPSQSETFELNLKTRSNTSLDLLDLDLSKRSDFGILEEQSPFKTPIKTPKKSPRKSTNSLTKCRRTLSESFIASAAESSAPLKRFSSTNKFSAFTKCDDDNQSNFDDIDKLIYGSPSKKAYKKPTGLDQLLTGTISAQIESPQKAPESPKEFNFNGRTYLVRTSNVAKKPNYATMEETALLDQLFRYGIRKLKPKQAVKILEYVYNQTHPYLIDESEIPSQTAVANDDGSNNEDQECMIGASKFNLKDCWGHILVSDIGSATEIANEQYIFQTNTSKKISTALLPFHIAWYNLVKSNNLLHEAILHYEPIDLQEIYLFFKRLGYRYDPKELKYFFDSRSIIFRYDLNKADPSRGASRHVRKKRHKLTHKAVKASI